jgi:hypothetical protein
MKRVIIGFILGATVAGGVAQATQIGHARTGQRFRIEVINPQRCQEDSATLQGRGNYVGPLWSRYVCIHDNRVRR